MEIKGNLIDLFDSITDYWSPKIISEVNEDYIKLAKFKGEIVRHNHENEDEMFYVIKGSFEMHLDDEVVTLNEGDFYVVKKGVMHQPISKEECWVMLIEKKETKHTGDVASEMTKSVEEQMK